MHSLWSPHLLWPCHRVAPPGAPFLQQAASQHTHLPQFPFFRVPRNSPNHLPKYTHSPHGVHLLSKFHAHRRHNKTSPKSPSTASPSVSHHTLSLAFGHLWPSSVSSLAAKARSRRLPLLLSAFSSPCFSVHGFLAQEGQHA